MTAAQPAHRGLFVAFEGGDGAGSTQVAFSGDWLTNQGMPSPSPASRRHRAGAADPRAGPARRPRQPAAEALLFAADKAHHVDTWCVRRSSGGEVVVTDRCADLDRLPGAGRDLGVARSPCCSTGRSARCPTSPSSSMSPAARPTGGAWSTTGWSASRMPSTPGCGNTSSISPPPTPALSRPDAGERQDRASGRSPASGGRAAGGLRAPSRFSRRAGHRCSHDRLGRRHQAGAGRHHLDRRPGPARDDPRPALHRATGQPVGCGGAGLRGGAAVPLKWVRECRECRTALEWPARRRPGSWRPRACRSRWSRPASWSRRVGRDPRSGVGGSSSSKTPTGSPSAPPMRCSASRGADRADGWLLAPHRPRRQSHHSHPARAAPYSPVEAVADLRPARRRRPCHGRYAACAAQSHVGLARRSPGRGGPDPARGRHRHGRRDPVGR